MWSLGLCRNIPAQSCVIMWSPDLCRNIPALSCVHPGLCGNMSAEPKTFDLCACSCMSYLVGYLKPDLCKSFSQCQREFAMTSSEPSTSRSPEEDSSAMDSD